MRIMKECHTWNVVFEACQMYLVWYRLNCSSKDPRSPSLSNFQTLLGLFLLYYYYKVPFHWKGNKIQIYARLSLICSETVKFTPQYHIWFTTYKYCKFERPPRLETSIPERFAFPRSLSKYNKNNNNKQFITLTKIHKITDKNDITTYTRITLSPLHVTWNHVQGLRRVESQLSRALLGSFKLLLNAISISPVLKWSNLQGGMRKSVTFTSQP
jgi:hypothetical protein